MLTARQWVVLVALGACAFLLGAFVQLLGAPPRLVSVEVAGLLSAVARSGLLVGAAVQLLVAIFLLARRRSRPVSSPAQVWLPVLLAAMAAGSLWLWW